MTTAPQAAPQLSGAAPTRYTLALPPHTPLINANDRRGHHAHAQLVKTIRQAACLLARHHHIPHLQQAHILYVVHPNPATRRRDPGNWAPSAKAAIDGLIDAHVLPDDNHTRLLGPDPRLGTPVPGTQLILHITDLTTLPPEHLTLLDPFHQITEATR